jgi:cell division protein FtsL
LFIIKRKKRTYYCKIIQMILIGFVITFVLMIGIVLVFSYSKFHDVLIDLKSEFNTQNEQNQKNIDNIKQKIKEYDNIFKKVSFNFFLI